MFLLVVGIFLYFITNPPLKAGEIKNKYADAEDNANAELTEILRQIEENTQATAFWVRVMGIPVLIGMVCGVIAMLLAIK
jgi:uncharacterized membrane protein